MIRKSLLTAAGVGLLSVVLPLLWNQEKYYFQPRAFAAIEPGKLYRGARQYAGPLRQLVRRYHFHTILSLTGPTSDEQAVVKEFGLIYIQIPMAGDGRTSFDKLDRAAAVMANPRNYPLFVHCTSGVHRTNAALAVFRMKYCGWGLERALAEIEQYGFDRRVEPKLYDHLVRYHAERIEASRNELGRDRRRRSPLTPRRVSASAGWGEWSGSSGAAQRSR